MISYSEFRKYFNRDFWKSFKRLPFEIEVQNKDELVKSVYNSILDKTYYPSVPSLCMDINKGKGVTRTVPVLDVKDYCVYYFCIKILESKIAINRVPNTYGGWTLGGAIRESEDRDFDEIFGISISPYSFNPLAWSKAYGDFNSKLFIAAQAYNGKFVAELDIANFYDSIRLDILENRIREITSKTESDIVSLLFHFLNYWNREINFYNKQVVGLPQDALADCSRILANFYLQDYDYYMARKAEENHGCYFRYADDQFFFAPTKDIAHKLVFLASKKLNCYGLSTNQKKVAYRTTGELVNHRSFDVFDILSDDETKDNPKVVEEFVDRYLSIRDSGLDSLNNRGLPLINKVLFRNIESLPTRKRMIIISDLLNDEYLLTAKADKLERIYALLDLDDRFDFVMQLFRLCDETYHNIFHYEVIKFLKMKKINTDFIMNRIEELSRISK